MDVVQYYGTLSAVAANARASLHPPNFFPSVLLVITVIERLLGCIGMALSR